MLDLGCLMLSGQGPAIRQSIGRGFAWGSDCRSRRKSNHSSLSTYVEDTKSRSKVPESEEDLANSGYASPSCFSLCWFAWKADCSVLQESAFPPYGWKLDPWRLKRMALAVAA